MSTMLLPGMILLAQGSICLNLYVFICINPKGPPILGFSPRFSQIFHHTYFLAYFYDMYGDIVRNVEDSLTSPSLQTWNWKVEVSIWLNRFLRNRRRSNKQTDQPTT